jgi:16S rRNA (uracil1498-N3)-methyltransferase
MKLPLFFDANVKAGAAVIIDPAEATHITKALRLRSGDEIALTDGRGHLFRATLEIVKHHVQAFPQEELKADDTPVALELAIAPTKNTDRLEWFIEKAVELGVGKITLIHCEHSERPRINGERLQRIAIAALKQSGRTWLPEISELQPAAEWLKSCSAGIKAIAHCMVDQERLLLRNLITPNTSAAIAIGPEGDFSQAEVRTALEAGFSSVSLGDARLRTETAALAAVHTYNLLNQS